VKIQGFWGTLGVSRREGEGWRKRLEAARRETRPREPGCDAWIEGLRTIQPGC
jgi:hypothetical protein